MITLFFEARRYRVQVQGRNVLVEIRELNRWVFRDQYVLPLEPAALSRPKRLPVLRAALRAFERVHPGDQSLRDALIEIGRDRESDLSSRDRITIVRRDNEAIAGGLPARM
jgi:hypothetical protein